MPPHKHALKPVTDTSVQSAGKVLQTRPFQPDVNTNQRPLQRKDEPEALTGGFDLTKIQYDFSPPSTLPLGQPLQAKLTIGEPNDKYEQEADRVAHDVVQRIHETGGANDTHHPSDQPQTNSLFANPIHPLQRAAMRKEAKRLQKKSLRNIQRFADGAGTASAEVEQGINNARGSGQSLAPKLQAQMGQAMGADFSGVRVHTDARADQLNRSVGAKAFTTGQDLFFKQGEYRPESRGGQELIAHELAHVVQQNGESVRRSPLVPAMQKTTYANTPLLYTNADEVKPENDNQYIQRKREVGRDEVPPNEYKVYIDKNKPGEQAYVEYAEKEYKDNQQRSIKILKKIQELHESRVKDDKDEIQGEMSNYAQPDNKEWDVRPKLGAPIRGFGVKIEYHHLNFMHDETHPVSYESQIKRDRQTGKIELSANANYAPTPEQRAISRDPHVKMNLNQIWASQIEYFRQLETNDSKYDSSLKEKAKESPKLKQIKRSKVENWSSLATYWITKCFAAQGGRVTDEEDWLALSGSPNGNAVLWLILQNPELGEAIDPEMLNEEKMDLYDIDVDHSGPYFVFN